MKAIFRAGLMIVIVHLAFTGQGKVLVLAQEPPRPVNILLGPRGGGQGTPGESGGYRALCHVVVLDFRES